MSLDRLNQLSPFYSCWRQNSWTWKRSLLRSSKSKTFSQK